LRITRNIDVVDAEDRQLLEIQRRIMAISDANRERLERTRFDRLQSFESSASMGPLPEDGESAFGSRGAIDLAQSYKAPVDAGQRQSWQQPSASLFGSPQSTRPLNRLNSTKTVANSKYADSDSESSDGSDDGLLLDGSTVPTNVVVQVDDDADEDLMAVLLDPQYPDAFQLCNTERLPPSDSMSPSIAKLNAMIVTSGSEPCSALSHSAQMLSFVKEGTISVVSHHPNRQLAAIFRELYEELQLSLSFFKSCLVTGIRYDIQLPHENEVHVRLTAMAIGQYADEAEIALDIQQLSLQNEGPTASSAKLGSRAVRFAFFKILRDRRRLRSP
jgi:hypothetical protein